MLGHERGVEVRIVKLEARSGLDAGSQVFPHPGVRNDHMAQSPAVEQGFGRAAVDQDFGPVGVFERRRGVGLDPNFGACGK